MDIETIIPAWPEEERPRERLLTRGAEALSDAELVAILLGHGTRGCSAVVLARELIRRHGGLSALGRLSPERLTALPGVGPAKAARLLAACELGRRRERKHTPGRTTISGPADAVRLASARLRDLNKECFLAIFLDTKNHVLKEEVISIGSLDQTPVHPREVFKSAIELSAAGVIAAHNHPSGDPTPSRADLQLTRQLCLAAKVLGIRFLDHVIIGDGDFRSLLTEGRLPTSGGGNIRARRQIDRPPNSALDGLRRPE